MDRSDELIRAFPLHEIDALISVGGDGSLAIANSLAKKGLRVVGVPKTIDNDLDQTVDHLRFRHRGQPLPPNASTGCTPPPPRTAG